MSNVTSVNSTTSQTPTPGTPPPSWSSALKHDLPASLVVFLVAVPLGLGIALASGAPLIAGLISCAVGGIVAGTLAGAPLQVSGPAAGLTLLVYGVVQELGWEVTLAATAAAGLIQLALSALRISRTCLIISPAVVKGMLAGIGVVIALAQLHVLLGGKPQSSALRNLIDLPAQIAGMHGHAVLLGVITLAILFAWPLMPKRVKALPAPLIAVLTATAISTLAWLDVVRVDLPTNLFDVPRPKLPASDWGGFAAAAFSIAIVASVESLLCAIATDKMHTGPRARLDKELMAQGAANTVAGLAGGLPVTGVIVRSTANLQAGAVTRASAILHGVWIVLFVVLLGRYVELIPLPALAGLLVYVGIKLVNRDHIRELSNHREVAIYFATLLGVTFLGLLQGVGIGLGLSLVLLLVRLSRCSVKTEERSGRWHVRIDGTLTFMTVPKITAALDSIPPGTKVDVDLEVDFMDHAAFDALHTWRLTHEKLGGAVDIDELHEAWYQNASDGKPVVTRTAGGPSTATEQLLKNTRVEQMHDLARGVRHFKRTSESLDPLFKQLARDGQSPNVLFLTCGDSRVVPDIITSAKPGNLFTIRNIGNLVPRYEEESSPGDDSVAAALEFTLDSLSIRNIVICGHSECGAMKALLHNHPSAERSSLQSWLHHGTRSLTRFTTDVSSTDLQPCDVLSRVNVVQQLDNLRTHPKVQARLAEGTLKLYGWYFDIAHAEVFVYHEGEQVWLQIDEPSATELMKPDSAPAELATLASV